jgi:hypothetical protein
MIMHVQAHATQVRKASLDDEIADGISTRKVSRYGAVVAPHGHDQLRAAQ